MVVESNTSSYALAPSVSRTDERSAKGKHGNFSPSCVTIESNPYLLSLFDFIMATLLQNHKPNKDLIPQQYKEKLHTAGDEIIFKRYMKVE